MNDLDCHSCGKVVLGRGVILINDQEDDRWHQDGDGEYFSIFGNGVQYMILHPLCFNGVWEAATQIEDHNIALTLCFGGIGDILRALTTDED